jgi:ribosomal protein L37AE/L43A
MARVRMIRRAFQDDMEVWECRECGASVAQIVDTARLARRVAPSQLLN